LQSKTTKQKRPWVESLSLLFPFFKKYRIRLAFGFSAILGVDFLQLFIPRVTKKAIDTLGSNTATDSALAHYALLILLLAAGIALCRFLWRYMVIGFSRHLERDIRDMLLGHLLTLDRLFFQRHTTGELMALATNDLAAVQLACGMGLIASVDAIVMTIAALSFMMYINPLLTVIAVSPMPVLAILTKLLSARLHKRFRRVQEQFEKLTEFTRSTLTSIRLLKAYTQEETQTKRFGVLGETYIRENLRVATVQGILFPVSGLVANFGLLLVLYFGGKLTIEGTITVGDFVAFVSYLFMLTWPMMAIGWVTNLFQRGVTSLDRIQTMLHKTPVLEDIASDRQNVPLSGDILLKDLSFSYPYQKIPAINKVNLKLSKGIYGLVGRTGSGKSTLCHVLIRLYPIDEKSYFLDGIDVNSLPLAVVRRNISYVPQETILFSDTIKANIAFGLPDAPMDEIEKVARAAAIHQEILAMKDGYQTLIGERGIRLSGGQRQRIALARALLLDRPIIIIDDGLSAVDMETEHAIILALSTYLTNKTCLIVSHRIAPLMNADKIFVLEMGRIAAQGHHNYLMQNNRFYAAVAKQQSIERIKRDVAP
jgi:ATP-binding cassette subfamily B protein